MHGNVLEWCSDWYDSYSKGAVTDQKGRSAGTERVLRGGSWSFDPGTCRAAFRYRYVPHFSWTGSGFRVVCSSPGLPR